MRLLELQRWMGNTVMRPLTPENRLDRSRLGSTDATASSADNFISPSAKLTAIERLEIYNRQFWFRLLDSMEEDFPAVRGFTGEDEFKALVVRYIQSHPSTHWTLRNLGMKFEAWLRASANGGESLAVASDMARVEWAYIDAYDAPEYPGLDPAELGQMGGALKLRLQPHVRLVRLDHAVQDFVAAIHEGGDATPASFPKGTEFIAVYRQDFRVRHIGLTSLGFLVLHRFRHWQTLEDVFSAELPQQTFSPNDAQETGRQFQEWSRLGFFSSPEVTDEESHD